MKRPIVFLVMMLLVSGCVHVVSKDLRDAAEKAVPVIELFRNPGTYNGRIFILGGTIVNSLNSPEGTYIEVVEKPLDYRGRPEHTDVSRGRFIVLYEGYLDPAIFSPGRDVTVAGEVLGTKVRKLGQIDYPYLFMKSRGLYLLKPGYDLPVQFGIGIWHSF
jgi:outer membrane lipoprotein